MLKEQVRLTSKAQQLINSELNEIFIGMIYNESAERRRVFALEFIELFADVVATETVRQLQQMENENGRKA